MGESEQQPEVPAPGTPGVSRSLIVVMRLLLLLAAGTAGVAAIAIAMSDRKSESAGAGYTCPMHPEVRSNKAAQCPICGMALTPEMRGASPKMATMRGMTDLTAVENVRKHKVLDFVRMRSMLFDQRELRGAAWVEPDGLITAVFYTDQANALTSEDEGTFSPTSATLRSTRRGEPANSIDVRRTQEPAQAWDRSTVRIRFQRATGANANALNPGQVGWIEMRRKARSVLTVPAEAVMQSPDGPYVLRSLGNFTFEKRAIEIGETFRKHGVAIVLSGLAAQDRVVARAAFFLDADRRLGVHDEVQDWGTP